MIMFWKKWSFPFLFAHLLNEILQNPLQFFFLSHMTQQLQSVSMEVILRANTYTYSISICLEAAVSFSLTQLSSRDGEVPVQNEPLLDALSVGRGLLVDSVDAVLDGGLNGSVSSSCDFRNTSGAAAQFAAQLYDLRSELVLWGPGLGVHLALDGTTHRGKYVLWVLMY